MVDKPKKASQENQPTSSKESTDSEKKYTISKEKTSTQQIGRKKYYQTVTVYLILRKKAMQNCNCSKMHVRSWH